jgi:hypothetical protein
MIHRAPFPTKSRDVAAKKLLARLIIAKRQKTKEREKAALIDIDASGDAAFVSGNGKREATINRLAQLQRRRTELLDNIIKNSVR